MDGENRNATKHVEGNQGEHGRKLFPGRVGVQ